jgi:hypothetical protein
MSIDPAIAAGAAARSELARYIEQLVSLLEVAEPWTVDELRRVVEARRARIILDGTAVDICFRGSELAVEEAMGDAPVSGLGSTDSATVLAVLAGHLEITDAVLDGRLEVYGEIEDVFRIFLAIEILLDGSSRVPSLQKFAKTFRSNMSRWGRERVERPSTLPRESWYPLYEFQSEEEMLARLDLLPD